jgi:hypothetical protein
MPRNKQDIHEFSIPLGPNVKVGCRMNNSDEVVAVHPDTPAANAGVRVGDLILAVDDVECTEGVNALKLWADGAARPIRKLRITRKGEGAKAEPEPALTTNGSASEPNAVATTSGNAPEPKPAAATPTAASAATKNPLVPRQILSLTLSLCPTDKFGCRIKFIPPNMNEVIAVHPDTPAARAGVVVGDHVLAVDEVECTIGVTAAKLWADGAGRPVRTLRVLRQAEGGQPEPLPEPHPDPPSSTAQKRAASAQPEPSAPMAEHPKLSTRAARGDAASAASAASLAASSAASLAVYSASALEEDEIKSRAFEEAEEIKSRAFEEAETLKNDGNRALSGGLHSIAAGLYTKAILVLSPFVTQHGPVAAAAAARAAPAPAAARASSSIDPLRHALASYYSNRSAVRSWALWTTRGACTCSPRRPPSPQVRLALEELVGARDDASAAVALRPEWSKAYVRPAQGSTRGPTAML